MIRSLALLAGLAAAAPALAQSNGNYGGTIACGRLANLRPASQGPFGLVVEGGEAAFSREAIAVDGSPMGIAEAGKAPIAADGALVFAASIEAGSFLFESRYEGRLGQQTGKLTGRQTWTLGKDRVSRDCTISLSRRSAPPTRREPQAAPREGTSAPREGTPAPREGAPPRQAAPRREAPARPSPPQGETPPAQ